MGEKVLVSKKTRTIKAPENKIVPYASKKKGTISLKTEASGILLDEESYSHEQNTARIADSLYIIYRKSLTYLVSYLHFEARRMAELIALKFFAKKLEKLKI